MCLDLLSLKSLSDIQVEMSKFRVNLQNWNKSGVINIKMVFKPCEWIGSSV